MPFKRTYAAIIAALFLSTSAVWAHNDAREKPRGAAEPPVETSFGRSGDTGKATRTVTVTMHDTMRFSPASLQVERGDTVRFVVKNQGKTLHEMVLGTMEELKQHAELMRKHPGMEHDEPYMAHVAPGATETIVWQFTRSGKYYYGCLIPGHFEAGMIGRIAVR